MLICDAYKPYIGKRFDAYSRIMGYENKLWSYLVFRDILKCSAIDVGKCPICLEEDKLEKKCPQCKTLFHKNCASRCDKCPICRYKFF
tara:strand:- start:1395 stop:1658 length:264 start_codon:yes stop_codon:yes gene_type:complete